MCSWNLWWNLILIPVFLCVDLQSTCCSCMRLFHMTAHLSCWTKDWGPFDVEPNKAQLGVKGIRVIFWNAYSISDYISKVAALRNSFIVPLFELIDTYSQLKRSVRSSAKQVKGCAFICNSKSRTFRNGTVKSSKPPCETRHNRSRWTKPAAYTHRPSKYYETIKVTAFHWLGPK